MPAGCYGRRKRIYTDVFSDDDSGGESGSESLHLAWESSPASLLQPVESVDSDHEPTLVSTYGSSHSESNNMWTCSASRAEPNRIKDRTSSPPSPHSSALAHSSPTKLPRSDFTPPTSPVRGDSKAAPTNSRPPTSDPWVNLFENIGAKSPPPKCVFAPQEETQEPLVDIEAVVQSLSAAVNPPIRKQFTPSVDLAVKPQHCPHTVLRTYGDTRSFRADRDVDMATEHSQMISDSHDYGTTKTEFDIDLVGRHQVHHDDTRDVLAGLSIRRGEPVEAKNQLLLETLVGVGRSWRTGSRAPDDKIVARLVLLQERVCGKGDTGLLAISHLISTCCYYARGHHAVQKVSVRARNQLICGAKQSVEMETLQVLRLALRSIRDYVGELPQPSEMALALAQFNYPNLT